MRVIGIGAEAGGAFRDEVELGWCGQVCFGGEDFRASFSGLIGHRRDDPSVMPGCIQETVKFTNVRGAEAVVVVYDDVKRDGGEGEKGEEGGKSVGGSETHLERKQMVQSFQKTRLS